MPSRFMTSNHMLWRYKWRLGMVNWIFHRIAGLALIFYLIPHVIVVRQFKNAANVWNSGDQAAAAASFQSLAQHLQHPALVIAEIFLLAAVLYHTLNGVKIMVVDFLGGARHYKALEVGMWAAFLAAFIPTGVLMFISLFK